MVGMGGDKGPMWASGATRPDPGGTTGPTDMSNTQVGPEHSGTEKGGHSRVRTMQETGEKDSSSTEKASESKEASRSGRAIVADSTMTGGGGLWLRSGSFTSVGGQGRGTKELARVGTEAQGGSWLSIQGTSRL